MDISTTVFGVDETSKFTEAGDLVDASTGRPIPADRYTGCRPRPIPECLDVLRKVCFFRLSVSACRRWQVVQSISQSVNKLYINVSCPSTNSCSSPFHHSYSFSLFLSLNVAAFANWIYPSFLFLAISLQLPHKFLITRLYILIF